MNFDEQNTVIETESDATRLTDPIRPPRCSKPSAGHLLCETQIRTASKDEAKAPVESAHLSPRPEISDGHRTDDFQHCGAINRGADNNPLSSTPVAPHPNNPGGQPRSETQEHVAVDSNDGAHYRGEPHPVTSPVIAQLIQLGRMRRRWHKAEKSLTLQGKAMARAFCEGDKDEANKLFTKAEKQQDIDPVLTVALMPFLAARTPFSEERTKIEKTMRKMARSLPVWEWVEGVKGLGDLRLAVIVSECGDISSYRNPSCLWKRMGLAVLNGERQRRISGNADLAIEHGYNAERRAVAYVMGTEIIKSQVRNIKDKDGKRTDESTAIGPYGQLYLDRKALENEREGITRAHASNRAARYMVKRVLRDLYTAWRV